MKTRKNGAVLFVVLLIATALIPIVYAVGPAVDNQTSDPAVSKDVRHHQIPYDYLDNAKPGKFLPESKMTNIIISQKTLERFDQNKNSALIEIPVSYLDLNSGFEKKSGTLSYYLEKGVSSSDGIVLLRMPTQIYEKFIEESRGGKLSLPSAYFYRFYANLDDLNSHLKKDGESVQITPSSLYPIPDLDNSNSPVNAQKSSFSKIGTASGSNIDNGEALSASSVPENYTQWASTWRQDISKNYKYCIGQIRPYSYSLTGSGADLFSLFAEREYKFSNNEAIEVVVSYQDRNHYGGIELAPAYYRSGAEFPLTKEEWYYWQEPVAIDPNDIPHAYGYHVQLAYSGQYVQVNFEDMETFDWTDAWFVQAATPISSFTELEGSSEYFQWNVPSTDSFTEVTNPVIDEWLIDTGNNWAKPSAVWQTTFSMNPITPPPYVSVSPSFDGYGNLITVSNAHYP